MSTYTCEFFNPEYDGKIIPGCELIGVFQTNGKLSSVYPAPNFSNAESRLKECAMRVEFVEEQARKEVYRPYKAALHFLAGELIDYQDYVIFATEVGHKPIGYYAWKENRG